MMYRAIPTRRDMASSLPGYMLLLQGKSEQAIKHFSVALRLTPDDPLAHFSMGNVLADRVNLEEAAAHHSEALRIKPDFRQARLNLKRAVALSRKSVGVSGEVKNPENQ